jgi:acetylglutamate kinase
MLANGASNVEIKNESDLDIFKNAMEEMSIVLAKSIARDGEGATKLIEAQAIGLDDLDIAKDIARKIVSSSLVKTAIYGESPNWGRVLAKIGEADISEEALASCEIYIQGFKVFANELPTDVNMSDLKKSMKEDTINITAKFTQGEHMPTIQMAMYSINKELSKTFSSININAIGMSGEDCNLLCCDFLDKNKYGYVGSITSVNTKVVSKLLKQQLIPVIATIGITNDYESVNINADDVATQLAIACDVDNVVFLTDQEGVYDENNKIFTKISMLKIRDLIDTKVATGGMKVKLKNISELLEKTKKSITILSGKEKGLLTKKIILGQNFGTTCVYRGNK